MAYTPMPKQQARGFYNPNMATPDWGSGIREMLDRFLMFKKQREQLQQQGTENQQAQQRIDQQQQQAEATSDYRNRMLELREKEAEPTEPDWLEKARIYSEVNSVPLSKAIDIVQGYQTPEQELKEYGAKEAIKDKYKPKQRPTAQESKVAAGKIALEAGDLTPKQFLQLQTGIEPGGEGGATATSILSTRRMLSTKVKDIFVDKENEDAGIFKDKEAMARYAARTGVRLDLPYKYTTISWMKDLGITNEKDQAYLDKVDTTVKWIEANQQGLTRNPKTGEVLFPAKKMDDVPGDALRILDIETLKRWFEINIKRKKVLGIF